MKKQNKYKISFPQMGDYQVPVTYLLSNILNAEIIGPNKISSKTIEIGSKYSPEFVCTPFKYTLGTLIESLDRGANVLIQAGGGCRYGYYSELQEQILRDLNYDFKFFNLVTNGKIDIKRIYAIFKSIDPKFSVIKGLYYLFITSKMIKYMDNIDHYIRANIGFEKDKNSFLMLKDEMLNSFINCDGYIDLYKKYHYYLESFKEIKIKKSVNVIKVGIIGELYTIMEPFSNYFLEQEIAKYNIEIKRFTNVQYLIFEKKNKIKKYLKNTKKYIKYKMGADASDNIARTKELCEDKYDGIIHIKSSFCTPEIGIIPIIRKICNDYNIPILFFTFDINTSEVGIKTRIEAFSDMIYSRREN